MKRSLQALGLGATVLVAGCGGGAATTASPRAIPSIDSAAGGLGEAAFTWCIDTKNQLALNHAASALSVDLDRIQAKHTIAGGTLQQYQADIRADADYAKACQSAYAGR